jgi:hypothetical protein
LEVANLTLCLRSKRNLNVDPYLNRLAVNSRRFEAPAAYRLNRKLDQFWGAAPRPDVSYSPIDPHKDVQSDIALNTAPSSFLGIGRIRRLKHVRRADELAIAAETFRCCSFGFSLAKFYNLQ